METISAVVTDDRLSGTICRGTLACGSDFFGTVKWYIDGRVVPQAVHTTSSFSQSIVPRCKGFDEAACMGARRGTAS